MKFFFKKIKKNSGALIFVLSIILIVFVLPFALPAIFSPHSASAQTQITISTSVPGIYGATTGNGGPGAFVANFYQFALEIGGLLAFAVVVYGGIKYLTSAGNPSGQSDAKEWIESALLGLLLLVGAFFILKVINPQLVDLYLPPLSTVNISSGGGGGTTNPTSGTGGGTCKAQAAGPCSVASLQNTCMGGNAAQAAEICNAESSGDSQAPGDISTNGQPVSIGLFQINISANNIPHSGPDANMPCTAAFNHTWHMGTTCGKAPGSGCGPSTITNPTLYAECAAAAQNIATNIAEACTLSKNGTTWNAWSTHTKCGL